MVVLSVAVVTSSGADGRLGKTLIARQFVEMTRLRVEGLLGAFPKLVECGRDHTFIETDSVRYVYQPMEALYLVMITNKSSNILEDLEILRLLVKVIQDSCSVHVNEDEVKKNAFSIIFAFDQVISFGHRESVTPSEIKAYTEMDSHEEKIHQMMEQSKINEAKEAAKKKSFELSKQKQGAGKVVMPGMGSMDMPGTGGGGASTPASEAMMQKANAAPTPWTGGMSMNDESNANVLKPCMPKNGMVLGKKKPGDFMASLGLGAGDPSSETDTSGPVVEETMSSEAPIVNPLFDPVKVDIEEKITANFRVEGGLQGEAECQGTFQVMVLDALKADLVAFKIAPQNKDFKYRIHPNLNKQSLANNILEVRDVSKAFRANTPTQLIKWRLASTNEAFLPVSLSCWPSSTADGTQIVVELELTDINVTLEDIHIRFPAAPSVRPQVQSQTPGEASYDVGSSQVHWFIPMMDKNESNGTFEFSVAADQASLMPFTFEAVRHGETKCPVEIQECYHMERKDVLMFHHNKSSRYLFTVGA